MFLFLRMLVYALSAMTMGQGFEFLAFDPDTGEVAITFNLKDIEALLGGAIAFAATFVSSRVAKVKGWMT